MFQKRLDFLQAKEWFFSCFLRPCILGTFCRFIPCNLSRLRYSGKDLNVELFASDKQHVLDLYCIKRKNCCYKFYWPSFEMAYGNPRFSELGKVLTKVALESSRMVLCSPDWGAHGGNEYWRTVLDKLMLTSIQLPDDAI